MGILDPILCIFILTHNIYFYTTLFHIFLCLLIETNKFYILRTTPFFLSSPHSFQSIVSISGVDDLKVWKMIDFFKLQISFISIILDILLMINKVRVQMYMLLAKKS